MLNVEYRLKLGRDEFVIKAEVKNEKEFFEQMSFYSNLPRTAPGGSDDLKLVFRTTKKGHKYYSLISEKEKMEFKLGQNLEANGGGLFPKGWQPAYQPDTEDNDQVPQGQPVVGAAPIITQQQQAAYPGLTNPVVGPSATMPTPVAMPTPPVQQTVVATAPQAAPAPVAAATQNPQVQAIAGNVLARFGIQKQ
jgi:hypothetical protein